MYSYDEAFKACLEYYNGSEIAASTFLNKYALRNNEDELLEKTPDDMHRRLAKEFARIEKKKFAKPLTEDFIYELFRRFRCIIPQGSPMYGIGNRFKYVTLSNCYVLESPEDSYSGIMKVDEDLVNISKRRGGVGICLDTLRPSGSPTHNSSKKSTGIVSWMERYSNSIREVGQDGRRGALMLCLNIHHPDSVKLNESEPQPITINEGMEKQGVAPLTTTTAIFNPHDLDFCSVKLDRRRVTGANISLFLTSEFLEAVKNDTDYEQRWPVDSANPIIKKRVNARKVWDKIIECAWLSAEPGLLFLDNFLMGPADCYDTYKVIATNPSLRKNTKILTNKGIYSIEELSTNLELQKSCKVKNIKGEWHNFIAFESGSEQELYKITFQNGQSIFCTKEHKWPLFDNNNTIDSYGQVKTKKTINLLKNDKIYFPLNKNAINNSNCNFTKDDGFILGWNLGDGWISYHIRKKTLSYGFIFSQEDCDNGISDRILNYTNSLSKNNSSLHRDHNTNSFSYCVADSNVLNKFQELKSCNKSEGIPESIWVGNHDFVSGFIDGLFSADCYVDYNSTISKSRIILTSSHEKLVNDIRKLLSFYGIRCSITKSTNKAKFPKYNSNKIYTRYDLKINGVHSKKFAQLFTLSNCKKQNKLNEILKFETKNNKDYLLVKSVEPTNIFEDVYDLTVDDQTNTFTTESGITSNCAEIGMCANDSCRLLVLNLLFFVRNAFTSEAYFDYKAFYEMAQIAQRLMDDLVDLEAECIERIIEKVKNDPEPDHIKQRELDLWNKILYFNNNGRRTGTGITAIGDILAAIGIKYGTEESIKETERIYKTLKFGCYRSSVDMAKELGCFTDWNAHAEKDCDFLNRINNEVLDISTPNADPEVYNAAVVLGNTIFRDMLKYGRRNIACTTTAPTGTLSLHAGFQLGDNWFHGTSSGIEPVFMVAHERSKKVNPNDEGVRIDYVDQNGDSWQKYTVYHEIAKAWMKATGEIDITKSPWYGGCANDINWINRVKLQAAAQRHICHSISSTINLPHSVTKEEVAEIYMAGHTAGVKGLTVYRDGCRTGILKAIKKAELVKHDAPKRPQCLDCDIHYTRVGDNNYAVIMGLYESSPYEVFVVDSKKLINELDKPKTAKIKRHARGVYELIGADNVLYDNIADKVSDNEEAITRLISSNLRHGCDIKFLTHQLEKVEGSLFSFSKAIARVLKKYIKDGESVSGEECQSCGGKLIRQSGCVQCSNCGWSKC